MQSYEHLRGSDEARCALEDLVRVGRRSVAAYRATERRARDHRVRTVLAQLRRDHQRHVRELAAILSAIGGEGVAWDGGVAPLVAVGKEPAASRVAGSAAPAVLEALERAESELRDAYAAHVERGYPEPLGAALARHLREEEAHLEWLEESRWWRDAAAPGTEERARGGGNA